MPTSVEALRRRRDGESSRGNGFRSNNLKPSSKKSTQPLAGQGRTSVFFVCSVTSCDTIQICCLSSLPSTMASILTSKPVTASTWKQSLDLGRSWSMSAEILSRTHSPNHSARTTSRRRVWSRFSRKCLRAIGSSYPPITVWLVVFNATCRSFIRRRVREPSCNLPSRVHQSACPS